MYKAAGHAQMSLLATFVDCPILVICSDPREDPVKPGGTVTRGISRLFFQPQCMPVLLIAKQELFDVQHRNRNKVLVLYLWMNPWGQRSIGHYLCFRAADLSWRKRLLSSIVVHSLNKSFTSPLGGDPNRSTLLCSREYLLLH